MRHCLSLQKGMRAPTNVRAMLMLARLLVGDFVSENASRGAKQSVSYNVTQPWQRELVCNGK
jgi:hypothetical protein